VNYAEGLRAGCSRVSRGLGMYPDRSVPQALAAAAERDRVGQKWLAGLLDSLIRRRPGSASAGRPWSASRVRLAGGRGVVRPRYQRGDAQEPGSWAG
jgi:hypothetical protein